ncbi:DUF2312 domain-containing protein [Phyllobacterium ifriqiyense]|uniref:DUF2312 domain-containing protein n=1 Tax=Phyllobacterium ifriqiyense TaxID=314238 RepID=UPI0033972898
MSDVVAVGQLRAFVERVERLEEEIKTLNDDKSEVYKEMRGFGFDVKAVRKVVAKRKLDPSVANEQDAVFDLYWDALTGASHVHVHEAGGSYAAEKGVDREARRKQRMSETMDDSVALSAEAVALDLIDPDAHEETVRIADAVARKFGNSPLNEQIDPDTGEITNSPETATRRLDGFGSVQDGLKMSSNGPNADVAEQQNDIGNADDTSVTAGETATSSENTPDPRPLTAADGQPGIQSSSPGCVKSDRSPPVVGQGCESGGIYTGTKEEQAVNNFEPPAFLQPKPMKTARDYRPHCQKPDACGASGLQHCYSCSKLSPEKSEVA